MALPSLPTTQETLANLLTYYRAQLLRQGVPSSAVKAATAPGSDSELRFRALANQLTRLFANEFAAEDASMPDTATGADLDRIAGIYGVARSAGAGAAGSVVVTTSAPVAIASDVELTADDTGLRYRTTSSGTYSTGDLVPIAGIDVGTASNQAAGAKLTWVAPPAALSVTATVATGGLTRGVDAEGDAELRQRLLTKLSTPPLGGNWADYRGWALEADQSVESAYVYPALQGPGTVHVAFTLPGNEANGYARTSPAALVQTVATYVAGKSPEYADLTLTGVAHAAAELAIKLTLSEPTSAGGPGGGWLDPLASRWPVSTARIASVVSQISFNVSATTAPPTGAQVSVYVAATKSVVRTAVVSSATVTPGSLYTVVFSSPIPDASVGDFVFPSAVNDAAYARVLSEQIALLDPGEKTAITTVLLRSYRHPTYAEGARSAITTGLLTSLQTAYPEVINASYVSLNGVTPTLPAEPPLPLSVANPPRVWQLTRVGFYPLWLLSSRRRLHYPRSADPSKTLTRLLTRDPSLPRRSTTVSLRLLLPCRTRAPELGCVSPRRALSSRTGRLGATRLASRPLLSP